MGLIQKLNDAMVEQSLARSTMQGYRFWNRKFYGFTNKPASQWTGADVRAFLLWLYDEKYSPVSRKQALNALAFTPTTQFPTRLMRSSYGEIRASKAT